MQMAKQAIETVGGEAPESAAPRMVPAIPAKNVRWNSEGFCWREARVQLPVGATLQDLNDAPEALWKAVQSNRSTALREWDELRIVSADGDWFATAVVTHADQRGVILCGIRKTDKPRRTAPLYEDHLYKVQSAGYGFIVVRKSDEQQMLPAIFDTEQMAREALLRLHPSRAA
jgi:hypothetical protein